MMGTRHMRSRRAAARRRGNTPALLPMPRQHRPLLSFGARPAGLVFDVAAWFAGARQGCAGGLRHLCCHAVQLGQGAQHAAATAAGLAWRGALGAGRAGGAAAAWLRAALPRQMPSLGPVAGRRLAAGALALGLALSIAPQLGAQQTAVSPDVLGISATGNLRADQPAGPTAVQAMRRGAAPVDNNAPVTFTADEVEYDRERGLVTARGHVEAWQGERVLRADEFTYNRDTGVATARGNVQLLEPDGQVLFAEEAELKDQFKEGVLREVRALLTANVRIAANGVRRTGGTINELSRVVYSACDLCPTDPQAAPAWQVRAGVATQDKTLQRITYRDAVIQVHGVPVFYTPYLSHPDPSAPRASGWLFPQMGVTNYLGAFTILPYFYVIDQSSDITVTPLLSTRQYPFLLSEYRQRFNNGDLDASFSLGALNGTNRTKEQLGGHLFLKGRFVIDDNWRAGIEINRATSDTYLQTIRTWSRPVYASSAFVEGFWGTEQYARIEMRAYQSLQLNYNNDLLPFVLPHAYYEYAPRQAVGGGHLTFDTDLLSVVRLTGTHTQRLANRATWQRQDFDGLGGMWTWRVQGETNGYWAGKQQYAPVNLPEANGLNQNSNFRAAADWRMPFVRYDDTLGYQVVEPRAQIVTGPRLGRQSRLPNEDSIDFEFTDANLFALNRFSGRDRMEGGTRADMAMRAAWHFPNGGAVEGLAGRSYAIQDDHSTSGQYTNDGLRRSASDYVARLRVAPTPWFESIARIRVDALDMTNRQMVDGIARLRMGRVTAEMGYLYSSPLPFVIPQRTREEVSVGGTARIGDHWRVNATAKYDLNLGRFALIQGSAGYEDECLIIEGRFVRRFNQDLYTHVNYPVSTVLLIHIGLKTLGDYYFRGM